MRLGPIFQGAVRASDKVVNIGQLSRQYMEELRKCYNPSHTLPRVERTGGWCPPETLRVVEEADPIIAGPVIGSGGTGVVMASQDKRFALKIPKSDVSLSSMLPNVCRESTLLDYIQATHKIDFFPKVYHPVPGAVSEPCASVLLVTDNVGPFTLQDVISSVGGIFSHNKAELVRIGIRLIQMTEALYEIQLMHSDLNPGNILFSDPHNIAGSLKLIDLGFARMFSEINIEESNSDLMAIVVRLVELSQDRYGRPDPSIMEIHDGVMERSAKNDEIGMLVPVFGFAIAKLREIDPSQSPIPSSSGVEVSEPDREMIKWTEVSKVRNIIDAQIDLESHIQMVQNFRTISEQEFQFALSRGFSINGQLVRFLSDDGMNMSTDGLFKFTIASAYNMEEWLREKRIDSILRSNGIPTFTSVPDGWVEGQDLLVDAINISRFRVPLASEDLSTWHVSRASSVQVSAAQIAVTMIGLLEQIHNFGLVHGNIAGSKIFGFSNPEKRIIDLENLVLASTGWGRMYVSNEGLILSQGLSDCMQNGFSWDPLSPAELKGFCPGRFDDLYRLSEILLTFIEGRRKNFGFPLSKDVMIGLKQEWIVHDAPDVFNAFHYEMFARSIGLDTSRPAYAEWIDKFQAVVQYSA